MTENEIENLVVDSVVTVHREIGPGLLAPIRKNNRGTSGVERLRTPVTGILIVGLQLSLDLPPSRASGSNDRDGGALEPH